jgi:O-antigen ligase
MIACLAVCLRSVLPQLSWRSLAARPITVSMIGLLAAVVLSHLSHLRLYEARVTGLEIAKKIAYYLLLVAVINSPDRLRRFITWFLVLILVVVLLGFLQFFHWIEIPELPIKPVLEQNLSENSSDALARISSVGVFNNPNDLARILLIAMPLTLFALVHGKAVIARCFWALALAVFIFALALTYSRGGFLGFLAGLAALSLGRFGVKKTLFLLGMGLPVAFLIFQGRQTDLEVSEGTGQLRILMWSDGLQLLRESPLFGIGYGEYEEQLRTVAHNSFVQCFVELGLLGGSCFLAAFYVPLRAWLRIKERGREEAQPEFMKMRPYLMAIFAGYGVSLLSSTRVSVEQTYLVFALATIYFQFSASWWARMAGLPGRRIWGREELAEVKAVQFATRCNGRLVAQVFAVGFATVIAIDLFVRFYARYGYQDL